MSVPVWQIPPVDIAKAVDAVRTVQLGQWMLRERMLIERELHIARSHYLTASHNLGTARYEQRGHASVTTQQERNAYAEQQVYAALDNIWTAQENLKRWEAWFA